MRFIIVLALGIAAVIGGWLLTRDESSPELMRQNVEVTATETIAVEKKDDETAVIRQPTVSADETVTNDATTESALELALKRYPDVSLEDIQKLFADDPELIGIRPDFMLALMERGDIAANQVMLSVPKIGPVTAAMYVVVSSRRDSFTVEHFDRLVALGADINNGEAWRGVMAMKNNRDVIDRWYSYVSLGPEVHNEMYNTALAFGNTALRDYLLDEKQGSMDGLQIDEFNMMMSSGMVRGTVMSLDKIEEELAAGHEGNREVVEAELAHILRMRLRQAQMLATLTDKEKELAEIEAFEQKLAQALLNYEQEI
ncbi:hypothetical protein [Pseudidiomarina insulisalsae]|uniref:Uncharacterized protein n=1 Tax=Pseudidiomarina insulisalsae TaxID=575789 RepID=A0A432YDR0_9GAMM|nr:hypothetical protein [Pseudidiomarina insulisalsae]RUO59006.1 hypothetical protein CWI71_09300 [Pseudidiomarina insulisalsae]